MKKILMILTTVVCCNTIYAGEWIGPNIATKSLSKYNGVGSGENYWYYTGEGLVTHIDEGSRPNDAYYDFSLEKGKRYRLSGNAFAANPWRFNGVKYDIYLKASGLAATEAWNTGWSDYTYKEAYGIASNEMTRLSIYTKFLGGYNGIVECRFKNPELRQVIYNPTFEFVEQNYRVNTSTKTGSEAIANITPSCLYADFPDEWSLEWGDGTFSESPEMNLTASHVYSIENPFADYQTWDIELSGSNVAGSGLTTSNVTVLRSPKANLVVNGFEVFDGQTIDLDITENPFIAFDLKGSEGFIENASFFVEGFLEQSGADLSSFSFTGSLFDENNIGESFTLVSGVSNTGLGNNSDYISVNLNIVPEPATMLFVGLGGLILRKRNR